jgi:hypothetical protein
MGDKFQQFSQMSLPIGHKCLAARAVGSSPSRRPNKIRNCPTKGRELGAHA